MGWLSPSWNLQANHLMLQMRHLLLSEVIFFLELLERDVLFGITQEFPSVANATYVVLMCCRAGHTRPLDVATVVQGHAKFHSILGISWGMHNLISRMFEVACLALYLSVEKSSEFLQSLWARKVCPRGRCGDSKLCSVQLQASFRMLILSRNSLDGWVVFDLMSR